MNYQEAIKKSLTVKWKVDVCGQGEQCWCRVIKCEEPIFFKENDDSDDEEYYVVKSGELNKETVEHIVKIHNEAFTTKNNEMSHTKTPIQKLIDKWEKKKLPYTPSKLIIQAFVDDAKAMLEEEKKVIEEAFFEGLTTPEPVMLPKKTPEEYYAENFNKRDNE